MIERLQVSPFWKFNLIWGSWCGNTQHLWYVHSKPWWYLYSNYDYLQVGQKQRFLVAFWHKHYLKSNLRSPNFSGRIWKYAPRPFYFLCDYVHTPHPMAIPDKLPASDCIVIIQIHSLVVGMLTPAPVQQLGRGERADPGVSQLTLPNSDSIAWNAWFQNVWQVSLTYEHSSWQMEVGR